MELDGPAAEVQAEFGAVVGATPLELPDPLRTLAVRQRDADLGHWRGKLALAPGCSPATAVPAGHISSGYQIHRLTALGVPTGAARTNGAAPPGPRRPLHHDREDA